MNRVGGSRVRWTGKPVSVGVSEDAAINYREALSWLYSLQRFGIKLGLENIERLLEELSKSDVLQAAPWKVIHVAGTNGKGSVCAMVDSICRAQGYRRAPSLSRPRSWPAPRRRVNPVELRAARLRNHAGRTQCCDRSSAGVARLGRAGAIWVNETTASGQPRIGRRPSQS